MSDNEKLNLPAIKKGELARPRSSQKVRPLDLDKSLAVSQAMSEHTSVQEEIARSEQGLDLVLVGDLTGSMRAYHALLKEKFSSLCQDLFPMIKNLRIGIVFYLDHGSGDPYATRVCRFNKNRQELEDFIRATPTGHGGDAEEAMEDAFADIVGLDWREASGRSVVLFGDARPHEPEKCPYQHSYFDLARRMFESRIVVNSVFCGEGNRSAETLQQLENVDVGNFSKKVANLDHPNFFSWIANVTGGMIIGVEQIDDLIEIIKAAAAKDSGNLEEYEKNLKRTAPAKLNLVSIAKKARQRRITAMKNLPGGE